MLLLAMLCLSLLSCSGAKPSSSGGSSNLCADFANKTRNHFGRDKAQFCDSRNGKRYVYVEIGGKKWMAENLNYNAPGSKCGDGRSLSDENTATCDTYGRLYNWTTAMANVCPSGWHIPNGTDWNVLMKFVVPSCSDNSNCDGAGTKLKATSGWNTGSGYIAGTDDYGFSALPGGYGYSDGYLYDAGNYGLWWSSSEDHSNLAYRRIMGYDDEYAYWGNYDKSALFSVRCLQD